MARCIYTRRYKYLSETAIQITVLHIYLFFFLNVIFRGREGGQTYRSKRFVNFNGENFCAYIIRTWRGNVKRAVVIKHLKKQCHDGCVSGKKKAYTTGYVARAPCLFFPCATSDRNNNIYDGNYRLRARVVSYTDFSVCTTGLRLPRYIIY